MWAKGDVEMQSGLGGSIRQGRESRELGERLTAVGKLRAIQHADACEQGNFCAGLDQYGWSA
jgi:hypothetical protein